MTGLSEGRRGLALAAAALVPVGLAGLSAASAAEPAKEAGADLAELAALVAAHDKAFDAQDIAGVLKTFAPTAVVVGTGPGELWVGHEEIRNAYGHFFQDFEPGKQTSEPLWRQEHAGTDVAWRTGVSKLTMTKGGKTTELGMNLSVVAQKIAGKWAFVSFHYSNLTPCPPPPGAVK